MPANEQTWRNIPLLHRVFAVSGIAMFVATIWVFWADQNREWRTTQTNVVDLDTQMIQWRKEQFETDAADANRRAKFERKLQVDAEPIDAVLLEQFAAQVDKCNADMEKRLQDSFRVRYDRDDIAQRHRNQTERANEAVAAWEAVKAAEAKLTAAEREYLHKRTPGKATESDRALEEAVQQARVDLDEKKKQATAVSHDAARLRTDIISRLDGTVTQIRSAERLALQLRKDKSAEVDKAKADVDIGIRDNVGERRLTELGNTVNTKVAELEERNKNYQVKNEHRVALQKIVGKATERQAEAAKESEAAQADLVALEKAYQVREENYVVFDKSFPWIYPGKGLLNLPILNAFNPPQKIENLWAAGNLQNYTHAMVRRFDRCTTCHKLMQATLPGQPQDPAYIHEKNLVMWLTPPDKEEAAKLKAAAADEGPIKQVEKIYGLRLAGKGLVNFDDVTVSLVLPATPAARAEIESEGRQEVVSDDLRLNVATFSSAETEAINFKLLPGLLVGDVIAEVEDAKADRGPARVAELLVAAASEGKPVPLTVRRGLPNPYTSHPRLDLFVGDASPHPMGTFGCTICHDGQGNATAFKWVSHTPNDGPDDPDQSLDWARKHGWFDNHHWIYPMWPKRFEQSGCLKCHHEVVELEASEKFPDPPAEKLTHGYHLIRKYGCYGCHEVNGYDGPNKRIGPDLRSEPNFYAAALQLGHLLAPRLTDLEQDQKAAQGRAEATHEGVEDLSEEQKKARDQEMTAATAEADRLARHVSSASRALELAPQVATRTYDNAARNELFQLFTADAAIKEASQRAFTAEMHRVAAVLKDVEAPGNLRKPGPTLRYVREKLDPVFLYDWTNNPKNFRPTTRMPQFFGLTEHLKKAEPKQLHKSQRLEPIEVHSIVTYLQHNSQSFVPLEKPKGIVEDSREEKIARGKMLFETRGCLTCHEHHDFPKAKEYRGEKEIVQGPELSGLAQKFDPQRNPKGREWLYSWIKNPTRYNVRTLMPNLYLDPLDEKRPLLNENGEPRLDENMNPMTDTVTTDPVADLVEYLLDPAHLAASKAAPEKAEEGAEAEESPASHSAKHEHKPWVPAKEADQKVDRENLKELVIEYLRESFHESRLEEYYENGLPERIRGELKTAEQDLVVPAGQKLTDEQRLLYVGRKTISKFGCYGCHDVPGFEDAKPIGTGLADWGRKDPSRLAFEHITHYLHEGHGHGGHEDEADAADSDEGAFFAKEGHAAGETPAPHAGHDEMPVYYERALGGHGHGNRIGFIYQKLREPRSYDYKKTENKKYNDRLRMPQFPFSNEEREAVITFVLGLVAEPPTEKYVYKPNERQQALIAGKQVLETFNCGGCHILEGERWKLSIPPDFFGDPAAAKTFPFALHDLDPSVLAKSANADRRQLVETELRGLPSLEASGTYGGMPIIRTSDGADFDEGEPTQPRAANYEFTLYDAAAIGGQTFQPNTRFTVPGSAITRKHPTVGGYLTKYLSPVVYQLERKSNPNAKGDQTLGWLPPPLMGEGKKVQTDWLYDFLMEPYAIRPATYLRMPKFNLSPDDTSKLVSYFAAKDNASYPYEFDQRRQSEHLAAKQSQYDAAAIAANEPEENRDRLEAAMKTVTSRTYCVQCHSVADFRSDNSPRAQGPDLSQVYRRLRPDYTRRWIANPPLILPYTSMPVNIKYDPAEKQDSDAWFHGTRTEQIDGLVDLLMNFDEYAKRQTRIADLVPPPMTTEGAAEPPAETGP